MKRYYMLRCSLLMCKAWAIHGLEDESIEMLFYNELLYLEPKY